MQRGGTCRTGYKAARTHVQVEAAEAEVILRRVDTVDATTSQIFGKRLTLAGSACTG